MEDLTEVGYIYRAHGYKGNVLGKITFPNPDIFHGLEAIFVEIGADVVPHMLERCTIQKKDQALIKIVSVDTEAAAKALCGSKLFLPAAALPEIEEDPTYVGYTVFNQHKQEVGTVTDYMDIPGNPLLEIDDDDSKLIPFHKDLIIEINDDAESIQMELTEGLNSLEDE